MGNYTTNLSLYNTDMNTDGNDTFDFQRDLNDNNDKIDSAIGKLSTLTTTDKSSLVNAIIEIVSSLGGKASKDLDNLSATGQAILDGKVEVEALLQQNGYAKFSWKENNVISNLIIQWGSSGDNWDNTPLFSITFNQLPVVIMQRLSFTLEHTPVIQENYTNCFHYQIRGINQNTSNQSVFWVAIGY